MPCQRIIRRFIAIFQQSLHCKCTRWLNYSFLNDYLCKLLLSTMMLGLLDVFCCHTSCMASNPNLLFWHHSRFAAMKFFSCSRHFFHNFLPFSKKCIKICINFDFFQKKQVFLLPNRRIWHQIQIFAEILCEKKWWHGIARNTNFGSKTLKNGMASFDESQHHGRQ